ncbi:MAG: DUF4926 domain-containing protein [Spirochaetia bacterium]|jgi:hypothetical protein|nr:DUF4926 domain-containing protein [Spirochaetia bacterium]
MTYKLFEEVSLAKDIPEKGLKRGDVATIVEHHPVSIGEEGYSLEVFNSLGDFVAVLTVPKSVIEPLTSNEIFNVRPYAIAL